MTNPRTTGFRGVIGDPFVLGADRNNPDKVKAHWYKTMPDRGLLPMCIYGWNRSDGHAFSILRGNGSSRGSCLICAKRMAADLEPVEPTTHKTRWL